MNTDAASRADLDLGYLLDSVALERAIEREKEFLDDEWSVIWRIGCRICGAPESWKTDRDYRPPFQDSIAVIYAEGLRQYQAYAEGQPWL